MEARDSSQLYSTKVFQAPLTGWALETPSHAHPSRLSIEQSHAIPLGRTGAKNKEGSPQPLARGSWEYFLEVTKGCWPGQEASESSQQRPQAWEGQGDQREQGRRRGDTGPAGHGGHNMAGRTAAEAAGGHPRKGLCLPASQPAQTDGYQKGCWWKS